VGTVMSEKIHKTGGAGPRFGPITCRVFAVIWPARSSSKVLEITRLASPNVDYE
jgi:hypothetical protein